MVSLPRMNSWYVESSLSTPKPTNMSLAVRSPLPSHVPYMDPRGLISARWVVFLVVTVVFPASATLHSCSGMS